MSALETMRGPIVARRRPSHTPKYPFATMRVGEYFFLPFRETNNMMQYASTMGSKLGRKFSTRLTTMRETVEGFVPCDADHENAITGIGVWRTE